MLEAAQVGARSHTHRTQVSLYEADGTPWLKIRSPIKDTPQAERDCGGVGRYQLDTKATDTPQGERDCVAGCGGGGGQIGQTPKVKGDKCGCEGVSPNVRTSAR